MLNNGVSFSHKTAYIGLNCAIKVIRGAVLMLPTQMSTRMKKRDRKRQWVTEVLRVLTAYRLISLYSFTSVYKDRSKGIWIRRKSNESILWCGTRNTEGVKTWTRETWTTLELETVMSTAGEKEIKAILEERNRITEMRA